MMNNRMKSSIVIFIITILTTATCVKEPRGTEPTEPADNMISRSLAIQPDAELGLIDNVPIAVFYNGYDGAYESQFSQGVENDVCEAKPAGDNKYSFCHAALDGVDKYNYYFLFPYHPSFSTGTQEICKPLADLFPVQYPENAGPDLAYDYYVGIPEIAREKNDPVNVSESKRIVAPLNFVVKDPAGVLGGEAIHCVSVSFENARKPVSGKFFSDHSENPDECCISGAPESFAGDCLTAVYPEGLKIGADGYSVWYSTIPSSFQSGQKISVRVMGEKKTIEFESTLPMPVYLKEAVDNKVSVSIPDKLSLYSKFNSLHQDFSKVGKKAGNSFIGSDGVSRTWKNDCEGLEVSNLLMRGGIKMSSSSKLSIPEAEEGGLKTIRVFFHEDSRVASDVSYVLTASSDEKSASSTLSGSDLSKGFVELVFDEVVEGEVELRCSSSDQNAGPIVITSIALLYEEEDLSDMDIYLCIGQSNMAGRGTILEGDRDIIPNVYILDDNDQPVKAKAPLNLYSTVRKKASIQGINPAWSFSKTVAEQTGRKILLVVNARGNTGIGKWKKGAEQLTYSQKENDDQEKWGQTIPSLYGEAVRRTTVAMNYGELRGILWHQGEANHATSKDSYKSVLAGIVNNLREDLGVTSSVPFVVGQIGQTTYEDSDEMNATLSEVGSYVQNAFCASSVGCEMNDDNLHFSRDGQILLGNRYAKIILKEVYGINIPEPESPLEVYDYSPSVVSSTKYAVSVGGQDVRTIPTKDPHVAVFGASSQKKVTVTFLDSTPSSVRVAPVSKNYTYSLSGNKMTIYLGPYDQVSIEPNGDTTSPLFIFVNPVEAKALAAAKSDSSVKVYEAGEIYDGDISLDNRQKIYIQGGAVVNGSFVHRKATTGASISGCGVIDARCNAAVVQNGFNLINAENPDIRDITILNNTNWTFRMVSCKGAKVDNVKAVGECPDNEDQDENDAIHLAGCENSSVTRCFAYSWDDAINVGTQTPTFSGASSNVTVEDCIGWNVKPGNTFTIGWPVDKELQDIVFRNCYAIHSGTKNDQNERAAISVHNNAPGSVHDITFNNIYVEDPEEYGISLHLGNHEASMSSYVAGGSIGSVVLEDIHILKTPPMGCRIRGYDESHMIDDVLLKNVTICGEKITSLDQEGFLNREYPSIFFSNVKFE